MAITAADIQNQSFSVDRKGYDVDEVDVFLEHVADEIDGLNNQIEQLQQQVANERLAGFDKPAAEPVEDEATAAALAEKDARIADLESQLEARRADDNAIAQALIVAQRSGDKIIADANAKSAATIQDAEDEANRILDKAENEKQKVIDATKKLEDEREATRDGYKELLTDFISDATKKLADLGASAPKSVSADATASVPVQTEDAGSTGRASVQAPIKREGTASYTTPQSSGATVAAATPNPTTVEKDLSGFGDADVMFEFDELD